MAVADLDKFQELLKSFLSTDNDTRSQAEEAYKNITSNVKVQFLLQFVCNGQLTEDVRSMAAVLLRRLFSSEFIEFYPKIPPVSQTQLKEQILLAVQNEQVDSIRHKIGDIAAEVARNLIDDEGNNQWPEFLQFLFQCANSPSPALKESALRMFASVPGIFGNQQANYLSLIKQMLQQSVTDTNYEVRFQAVRAIAAFIILHEKESNIHKHFSELLPAMIQVIMESMQKQDDDALMKLLIDMSESTPKYLRPQLESIMEVCIKVLSDEDMQDSWRQLGLEVLVTLSETAPAMMRKVGAKYIGPLVQLILKIMTDLEDDDEWSVSDQIIEEDNDSNSVIAESALDRIACGLGGKTVLPHIIQNIPAMLANSDWKKRHAALMAISAVGEGCHKQMEDILSEIMDGVVNYLNDPHPRVRYAACNAVGQMSTDFAPMFEKKFHDKVIPGLLMVLDDNLNPRVQAHAGAALVNFSEDCPKVILTPYLNGIMAKLESILTAKFHELLEKGTKLVLEQIITTIASVADTCEEQFVAYYDRLMPSLKYIIQNANHQDHKMLRGKAIECVSLIGLAVGTEKFADDAEQVMNMLLKTYVEEQLPDDDPQISYLISAWTRICKVLGKQFEKYLPLVMGTVLRTAAMKPEVALLDNQDLEGVESDVDWQFVSLGEQQNFGIKTAGLEDKATACEMLVCYARELKEGFVNYAEDVVKLMVPMLKFYFHDGVRTAAAQSLPCLLECGKIKGPQYLEGMWLYICPELMKAIYSEPEAEVVSELLFSMAKCIETLGAGCLNDQSMTELLRILNKLLNDHFEKANERLEKRKDEDYDEVVKEQLDDQGDEDLYTLSKTADILHALFSTLKSGFFPYFDQIYVQFVKLLAPERPWSDHQWALCVFDDMIEFGGPECAKYQEFFLRPMIEYVTDKSAEVRQAAAYGCGTLGQFAGEAFAQACAEAVPRLMKVIMAPESRSPENVFPTENAISAVTKILKYNNMAINVDEILPHWLSWLPVTEDKDEAVHVYGYLCDLIEANHPTVLGPNNANLPRLISFFAEAFLKEAVDSDKVLVSRILNIIRQIQSNETMFQACVNQLTEDQRQALHAALSTQTSN